MAAVSFAGIKSSSPMDKDLSDLYYVVDYLRATQTLGHILHKSSSAALRLYCEVDASYLLHPDSEGHTGYNISFYGTICTFHNRSVKQTAVATSSTHAEARAIFTLAKELNFLVALCQELRIPLELPAIIMEDNSAVVTMTNNDSGYTKKCRNRSYWAKSKLAKSSANSAPQTCTPCPSALRNSSLWLTRSLANRHLRNNTYFHYPCQLPYRRKQCLVSWTRMRRANQASRRSDHCRPIPH
jgi:hypothetical protein